MVISLKSLGNELWEQIIYVMCSFSWYTWCIRIVCVSIIFYFIHTPTSNYYTVYIYCILFTSWTKNWTAGFLRSVFGHCNVHLYREVPIDFVSGISWIGLLNGEIENVWNCCFWRPLINGNVWNHRIFWSTSLTKWCKDKAIMRLLPRVSWPGSWKVTSPGFHSNALGWNWWQRLLSCCAASGSPNGCSEMDEETRPDLTVENLKHLTTDKTSWKRKGSQQHQQLAALLLWCVFSTYCTILGIGCSAGSPDGLSATGGGRPTHRQSPYCSSTRNSEICKTHHIGHLEHLGTCSARNCCRWRATLHVEKRVDITYHDFVDVLGSKWDDFPPCWIWLG